MFHPKVSQASLWYRSSAQDVLLCTPLALVSPCHTWSVKDSCASGGRGAWLKRWSARKSTKRWTGVQGRKRRMMGLLRSKVACGQTSQALHSWPVHFLIHSSFCCPLSSFASVPAWLLFPCFPFLALASCLPFSLLGFSFYLFPVFHFASASSPKCMT